jgi:nicotinate-nucleotide adenylyltransferase
VSRRLGILGGSFDPVHLGHLRSAEEVREAFDLDQVAFVPVYRPPHKPDRMLADGHHRLAMVELAVAGNPSFRACGVEIERGGVSYSIETLEAFAANERGAQLYFIVGNDAFGEMQTWKDAPRLFELANVVVTNRPPHAPTTSIEHLPVAARGAFCYDPATLSYRHRSGTHLHFLRITGLDISATAVRERVRRGGSIRYLVPADVDRYLREHGLYRSGELVG